MTLLAGLILVNALSVASLEVDLPEGRQITVMNDLHEPMVMAHELQVNTFMGSGGEGVIRMAIEVPGMHGRLNLGPFSAWSTDDHNIQVIAMNLVGIATSPSPRVYLTSRQDITRAPGATAHDVELIQQLLRPDADAIKVKKAGIEVEVRATDWFENAAIAQLRAGNTYVAATDGKILRGMGAVRAGTSCLRCHDGSKEGDLLGAFTWMMWASPSDNLKMRQTIALELANRAPAADLWKLVEAEPRRVDGIFELNTVQMQLDLRLARTGFVTDSLVAEMREQRAGIECKHLHHRPYQNADPWPSFKIEKVTSKGE